MYRGLGKITPAEQLTGPGSGFCSFVFHFCGLTLAYFWGSSLAMEFHTRHDHKKTIINLFSFQKVLIIAQNRI